MRQKVAQGAKALGQSRLKIKGELSAVALIWSRWHYVLRSVAVSKLDKKKRLAGMQVTHTNDQVVGHGLGLRYRTDSALASIGGGCGQIGPIVGPVVWAQLLEGDGALGQAHDRLAAAGGDLALCREPLMDGGRRDA